ncbi:MAG TPA: hypothetical protein VGD60_00660, partial [Candidatus Acidoferrales bacterium]
TRKLLDQQLVTEYAKYRALKSKIEKWLKAVREELLAEFKSGSACPADGPYLLVVEPGSRSNVDWKQELFDRLKADFEASGSACDVAEELAIARMVELERAAGRKKYFELAVKTNPSYAGKLMRAIVKRLDTGSERGF